MFRRAFWVWSCFFLFFIGAILCRAFLLLVPFSLPGLLNCRFRRVRHSGLYGDLRSGKGFLNLLGFNFEISAFFFLSAPRQCFILCFCPLPSLSSMNSCPLHSFFFCNTHTYVNWNTALVRTSDYIVVNARYCAIHGLKVFIYLYSYLKHIWFILSTDLLPSIL